MKFDLFVEVCIAGDPARKLPLTLCRTLYWPIPPKPGDHVKILPDQEDVDQMAVVSTVEYETPDATTLRCVAIALMNIPADRAYTVEAEATAAGWAISRG